MLWWHFCRFKYSFWVLCLSFILIYIRYCWLKTLILLHKIRGDFHKSFQPVWLEIVVGAVSHRTMRKHITHFPNYK